MRILLCAAALAALLSSQATAAFDLQITEMYGGTESLPSGDNVTDDWFEVTNFGTTAWTSADGTLYFDDDSADATAADPLVGITSIAPGESVIFVDEFDGDLALPNVNLLVWEGTWATPLANDGKALPQIGQYAGSGMSNDSSDGATLFIDTVGSADPNDFALLDAETYPDPDINPGRWGRTFDSDIGLFSFEPAATNAGPNADGFDLIGSPGYLVPEPTTLTLIGLGFVATCFRRRK